MRCQQTFLCALLGLLAVRCRGEQAFLQRAFASDAAFLEAQKDGFHSHLQRMLQVEPVSKVQPGAYICSPAALKRDGGCKESDVEPTTIPKPEKLPATSTSSVAAGAPNCTGPKCQVAPMPGAVPSLDASSDKSHESSTGGSQVRAPQARAVTFGPMTHGAFERLAQRKRVALKAKLEESDKLSSELDASRRDVPTAKDDAGIPLPASRTTTMPTEPHIPSAESESIAEAGETPAPQPIAVNSKADFEMRFEPQTPSPDPHFRAPEIVESPAPARALSSSSSASSGSSTVDTLGESLHTEDDFEMRFEPQTPALDPHLRTPAVVESPAAAHLSDKAKLANASTCAPSSTNTSSDSCTGPINATASTSALSESSSSSSAAGPSRPPMTEAEAARIAAQQAVNAAAREAALARKREQVRSEQKTSQAKKGKTTKPVKEDKKRGGGSSQRIRPQSPSAGAAQGRVNEVERTLLLDSKARVQKSSSPTAGRVAKGSQARAGVAVVSPALLAAASPAWDILDYVCVLSIAGVLVAALFVAAAIVEDMTAARQATRPHGTSLPVHWVTLSRGLWRRCRRSFALAAKHLSGHTSDLPLSAHDSLHGNALGQLFARISTFIHVFLAHLSHLRSSPSGRSRASSSGGGALDPAVWVAPVAASSSSSPFAALAFQQVEDSSTATAMAELQLRRRH